MKKLILLLFLPVLCMAQVQPFPGGNVTASSATTFTNKDISSPTNNLGLAPLNLQRYGACGITNATSIWNTAVTLAAASGQALYIPGGCTINHTGILSTTVSVIGDGSTSILNATDQTASNPNLALEISGTGVVVRSINFQTTNTTITRATAIASSAIASSAALTNFSIDHNYFTSQFASTDIQLLGFGSHGIIADNLISTGPLSNPIILQADGGLGAGPNDVIIERNDINGGGDTCVELTYATEWIIVANNTMNLCGAHGVSVIGGQNIVIAGNTINAPVARGIDLEANGAFTLADIAYVTVVGNTINGANTGGTQFTYILAQGDGTHKVRDSVIANNVLNVTNVSEGINLGGGCSGCSDSVVRTQDITVANNIINGDGVNAYNGIECGGIKGCYVTGNTIKHMQKEGIKASVGGNGAAGIFNGNHLIDLSLASSGTYAAIGLGTSGFDYIEVNNNDYFAGANAVSNFAVCTGAVVPIIVGNNGSSIVNSCTSTLDAATQSANAVYAGPSTGSAAAAAFRALVAADIPAISLAGMSNLAANSIIGNNTGSPATPLALTASQVKTLLAISNTDVSGLGTFATANAATPPAIGGTTPAAGSFTTLNASGQTQSAGLILGNATGTTYSATAAAPLYLWDASSQGTDLKNWAIGVSGTTMQFRTLNDAVSTAKVFLAVTRTPTTTISTMVYGNATDNPSHTFNGAVLMPTLASSSAATTGTVCWTTSTGNLNVDTTTTCLLSDGRLKMNVSPLDVGIDEVMKLNPVSYELKPEVNPSHLGRQVGLIAQDVMAVDPRLAATYQSGPNEGTPSGVRYEQMVALLVKAMQEQEHKIDRQQLEIYALAIALLLSFGFTSYRTRR